MFDGKGGNNTLNMVYAKRARIERALKLIIFDFDGTLVDSRSLILESHRVVFGEF
jgi:hypothetical protein